MTKFKFSGELFPNERRMLDAVAEAWLSVRGDPTEAREVLNDFTDDQLADEVLASEWAEDETWNRDGLTAAFARLRHTMESA